MRKIFIILVVTFLSCSAQAQVGFDKPDDLAREVLEALRRKNFKEYKMLIGTNADMLGMFKARAKGAKSVDMYKLEKAAGLTYNSYLTHMGNNFEYILTTNKEKEFKWEDVKYVGSQLKETVETIDIPGGTVKRYRIELYFKAGDKKLKLHLTECYKLERGWVNYGNLSWKWR